MPDLVAYLTQAANDPLGSTDPGWRQFVSDHKYYIIAYGLTDTISDQVMTQVQYNLGRYLRTYVKVRPSLYWVVCLINNICGDLDFNDQMLSSTMYLPNDQIMETLYQTYQTIQNN